MGLVDYGILYYAGDVRTSYVLRLTADDMAQMSINPTTSTNYIDWPRACRQREVLAQIRRREGGRSTGPAF